MTSGPRITCVVNSLSPGGAERAMNWLAGALSGAGCCVSLFTLAPADDDYYEMEQGVARAVAPRAVTAPCRWFNLRGFGRRLAALRESLLETRPDLVISFVDTLNIQVLLALYSSRVPVIVSERVYPPSYHIGPHWEVLRSIAYPRAQAVVVQTRMVADWAQARWPRWRVAVIPNAVPLPRTESPLRPSWFGKRNIVAMGRMVAQKNFPLLIGAFADLALEYPDWHLTIAGDGPERESLLGLARSLNIGDRVHLPGQVRSPWSSLRLADIFVMSSNYEGFPNALAEAMAHGLPVVSTNCPTGPADIIRADVDGMLVGCGDRAALAAALATLMADDAVRANFAARAPEVCSRFSEAAGLDKWRRLIAKILDGASRA